MPNKPTPSAKRSPGRPAGQKVTDTRGTGKERCLQAAAELFLETPLAYGDPLARLSKRAVAKRANVAPATVDNAFRNSEDWTDELAAYLLGRKDTFREEFEIISREVEAVDGLAPIDAIGRTAETDIGTLIDNPAWKAMEILATCVAPRPESAKVGEKAREKYRDLDDGTWDEVYGILMKRLNREPRPPFTSTMVGALLQALVEGCGIRHLFDAGTFLDVDRLQGQSDFGAYAYGVAALLSVLTTPSGRDERTVKEVVSTLLGS